MISRILLAVDDSPAALAATATAVDLAAACGATLRAVTVVADHEVTELLRASGDRRTIQQRREGAAGSVLRHVTRTADRSAVPVETSLLAGEPAPRILDEARTWSADLIVVGRAALSGPGQPYVGGQTRHVLEFADVPVMVVPPSRR